MSREKIISLKSHFDKWWANVSEMGMVDRKTGLTDRGIAWLAVQSLAEYCGAWCDQRQRHLGVIHVDELAKKGAKVSSQIVLDQEQQLAMYRDLCAQVYQAAGAYDLPTRFLDALGDGATGEFTRWKGESLLPCNPKAPIAWATVQGVKHVVDKQRGRADNAQLTLSTYPGGDHCVPIYADASLEELQNE